MLCMPAVYACRSVQVVLHLKSLCAQRAATQCPVRNEWIADKRARRRRRRGRPRIEFLVYLRLILSLTVLLPFSVHEQRAHGNDASKRQPTDTGCACVRPNNRKRKTVEHWRCVFYVKIRSRHKPGLDPVSSFEMMGYENWIKGLRCACMRVLRTSTCFYGRAVDVNMGAVRAILCLLFSGLRQTKKKRSRSRVRNMFSGIETNRIQCTHASRRTHTCTMPCAFYRG